MDVITVSDGLADPDRPALQPKRINAVIATVVGNTLEWFDFAVYAFFVAIIARNFFPTEDRLVGLMSTFAAFGVGFVARPLGAVAFGWLGDRHGRKLALLIAMPMMGLGTLIVGLTPNHAAIGVLAPLLLTFGRLLQGFSAGGEAGNAIAFLSEWAPSNRRAFYSSLQQCSGVLGSVIGSGCAALITAGLSEAALNEWGWRIPFLLGGLVIAPLGLFLRRHVEETPVYESEGDSGAASLPRGSVFVRSVGLSIVWVVSFYVYLIYLPTFIPQYAGLSAQGVLWANTAGLASMVVGIPLFAMLSDRIGRKPPLVVGLAVSILAPYPIFLVLTGAPTLFQVYAIMIPAGLLVGVFAGIIPVMLTEMFSTAMRTTGVSTSIGLATALFGGFAPFLCTWLIKVTGQPIAPVYYLLLATLVSAWALSKQEETAFRAL